MRTHTTYERMNTKLTTQSKVKNRFPSITKVVIQYKHVQVEKIRLQFCKPYCSLSLLSLSTEVEAVAAGLGSAYSFNITSLCRCLQRAEVVYQLLQLFLSWTQFAFHHCNLLLLCNKNKSDVCISTPKKLWTSPPFPQTVVKPNTGSFCKFGAIFMLEGFIGQC